MVPSRKLSAAVIFTICIAVEITFVTGLVSGPTFSRLFGLSKTELGIVLGAGHVGLLFMSLLAGRITRRRGAIVTLSAGLVCGMTGIVMVFFAAGFVTLVAGLAVVGVGGGLMVNGYATLLADIFRDNVRRVMALASALWFSSSSLSAPIIGAWLKEAAEREWGVWSFRPPYLFDLLALAVCLFLVHRILRRRVVGQANQMPAESGSTAERPGGGAHRSREWLWIPALAFCHGLMVIVLLAWASPMVQAKFGVKDFQGAVVFGGIALGHGAGRFLLALARLPFDERSILAASGLFGAVLFALGLAAPTYGSALAAMSIGGFLACAPFPCILSLIGTRFAHVKAALFGYMEASIALAGLLGPPFVGMLADRGVALSWALAISPLAALALGVLALVWKLRDRCPVGPQRLPRETGAGTADAASNSLGTG